MGEREAKDDDEREGFCPHCGSQAVHFVTDCFDRDLRFLCDLWYCTDCRNFHPRNLRLSPAPNGRKTEEARPAARRHPRFAVQFVVEVLRQGARAEKPVVASVMDASSGGACFLFPEPLAEGEPIAFRISLPSATHPFEARARVVRCVEVPDGQYGIAVEFTEIDPDYQTAFSRYIRLANPRPV